MTQTQPIRESSVAVMAYSCPADLAAVRTVIREGAVAAGLPEHDVCALQTAVNELASNTLVHTGEGGVVSVWVTEDDLRVTVADSGHLGAAAHVRSADDPAARRGLLLVSALCEQVSIRDHPDGTTVHIVMPRPLAARGEPL